MNQMLIFWKQKSFNPKNLEAKNFIKSNKQNKFNTLLNNNPIDYLLHPFNFNY